MRVSQTGKHYIPALTDSKRGEGRGDFLILPFLCTSLACVTSNANYTGFKKWTPLGWRGGMRRRSPEDVWGREMNLCDSVTARTCHYAFVQTQRTHTTTTEPQCELRAVGDSDESLKVQRW